MRRSGLLLLLLSFTLAGAGHTQDVCRAEQTAIGRPGEQLGCSVAAGDGITAAGGNLGEAPGTSGAGVVEVGGARIHAPDAAPGDQFGFATALDGDLLAVGAPEADTAEGNNAGAVYLFRRQAGQWAQEAKLTSGGAGARFGAAVALQGDTLAVGAPGESGRGSRAGAVYVFERIAGSWQQRAWLTGSRTAPFDELGTSVDLDRGAVAAGAPFADGRAGGAQGAVLLFERRGDEWREAATLTAGEAAPGDQLGFAVTLEDGTLAAGARRGDIGNLTDAGWIAVFRRGEEGWRESARITAGGAARAGDLFGASVALSGPRLLAGAPEAGGGAGAAYLFQAEPDGSWPLLQELRPDPRQAGRFGFAVALDGVTAVVGAYLSQGGAGAVSILTCRATQEPFSVTVTDDRATVVQGEAVVYRIGVRNAPPGAVIRVVPSPKLEDVALCRDASCSPDLSVRLAEGGDASLQVTGRVRFGVRGPLALTVSATPPAQGTTASDEDRILLPDLACEQVGTPPGVRLGREGEAVLSIRNRGAAPASRVRLEQDPTPAGLQPLGTEGCPLFPCELRDLAPGAMTEVRVRFRVPPQLSAPGVALGASRVAAAERESDAPTDLDNHCAVRVQVEPAPPIPGLSPPGLAALALTLAALALLRLRRLSSP